MSAETQVAIYHTPMLFVALELASKSWKVATSAGAAQRARVVSVDPYALGQLEEELAKARRRFGLPPACEVKAVMEAGRDGFAVHRWLADAGIESIVIDPASVEVSRHKRRAKTDRLDAEKLVANLVRYHLLGEQCWRVCRVPSEEEEDRRHLMREREKLVKEQTSHVNALRGLLTTQGINSVSLAGSQDLATVLEAVRDPRGRPVMPGKRAQILREWDRLQLVRRQLRDVELQMNRAVAAAPDEALPEAYEKAARIAQSKGIGAVTALTLALELFGWREFRNRREVGSVAGLVPTPYNTGESAREQGISKAGNARVRRVMIEAAWSWLRYQPESALSKWFNAKFAAGKRKKGIVALARKLLIAFWRVAETGVYPEGTVLKSAGQAKGA